MYSSITIKVEDDIDKLFNFNIGFDFEHFCPPTATNCP